MPRKSLDVLILFILVLARIRIDTLADNVLPDRHQDVRRLLAGWWPGSSLERLAQPETDPASMMLIVLAVGLLVAYLALDVFGGERRARAIYRAKLVLIYGLIGLLVFGKTALLIGLRQQRGPASYTHDGGVIQTEATIDYFLAGLNPYVEDYVNTPLAEWGFSEYRTALYHFPYLPWTFVFSTPFYLLSRSLLGWFDQRLVYLLLFALTLALTQALVPRRRDKLIAVAIMGLNPILAVDVIFGQNDSFVLFWIVLGLWLLRAGRGWPARHRHLLGSAAFGLACASKPTAWFLAPFWLLYLLRDRWGESLLPPRRTWSAHLTALLRRAWTLPALFLLLTLPWFVWNPGAMYDDVWRWAAGQGETGYQIWGWGASNIVLGLGWVQDRFQYWPFIIPELLVSLPLLAFLLRRQARRNTVGAMLSGYVVLLLTFFFFSRFLQPNYLGYLLGFLTLAYFIEPDEPPAPE
ncbi:MAG: hypothetical protein ACE5H9_15745 [Anaerolineae bacterium]